MDPEEAWLQWQAELAAQQEVLQDLDDREVGQQLEINSIRSLITAPTGTQRARNDAQSQLEAALAELDQIRVDIGEAQAEFERIQASSPGAP